MNPTNKKADGSDGVDRELDALHVNPYRLAAGDEARGHMAARASLRRARRRVVLLARREHARSHVRRARLRAACGARRASDLRQPRDRRRRIDPRGARLVRRSRGRPRQRACARRPRTSSSVTIPTRSAPAAPSRSRRTACSFASTAACRQRRRQRRAACSASAARRNGDVAEELRASGPPREIFRE